MIRSKYCEVAFPKQSTDSQVRNFSFEISPISRSNGILAKSVRATSPVQKFHYVFNSDLLSSSIGISVVKYDIVGVADVPDVSEADVVVSVDTENMEDHQRSQRGGVV